MEFEEAATILRALGDPTRARIYAFLGARTEPVALGNGGEVRSVCGATVGEVCCHVTGRTGPDSRISFHLKELRLAGLVEVERRGKFLLCRRAPGSSERLAAALARLEAPDVEACP